MNCLTVRPRNHGLNRGFDSLLDDWFGFPTVRNVVSDGAASGESFSPRVNIRETENDIRLTFELPGLSKDNIKVVVKDDLLTVSGDRELKSEEKDNGYIRREIRSGSFSRSFTLPDSVDSDKISADYKDGLLELTLARREEVKPREVKVQVS